MDKMATNKLNPMKTSLFNGFFRRNNMFPTYSKNTATEGIQTAEEWGNIRKAELYIYNDIDVVLRINLYRNQKKIASAINLFEVFDFSKIRCIGSIGDSPFIHSIVIHDYLNQKLEQDTKDDKVSMKFLLTDFESISLDYGRKLGLVNTEFAKFDLNTDDLRLFTNCNLILMWGVDCVVEDSTLLKLFKFCAENNTTLIIGSINVEFLKFNWKRFLGLILILDRVLQRNNGFLHAYLRTQKYFKKLSQLAMVECQVLFADEVYRVYKIN